jgi:hypothetical protein
MGLYTKPKFGFNGFERSQLDHRVGKYSVIPAKAGRREREHEQWINSPRYTFWPAGASIPVGRPEL